MSILSDNIKLLREEAYLSKEDIAYDMHIDKELVDSWENGTIVPDEDELSELCKLIHIHPEDILSRNLVEERGNADKAMRKNSRKDFNWYYGSRSTWTTFIVMAIVVPVVFLLVYFIGKPILTPYVLYQLQEQTASFLMRLLKTNYILIYSYAICSFICGVFMLVLYFKSHTFRFQWWYIFFIEFIIAIFVIGSLVLFIPCYIYILYQAIWKRGKNR